MNERLCRVKRGLVVYPNGRIETFTFSRLKLTKMRSAVETGGEAIFICLAGELHLDFNQREKTA